MDSDGNAWDVVGVEPYDDTAQTSQVILLRPHAQSATVIAPDGGNTAYVEPNGERSTVIVPAGRETVYVEPNGDRVIYLFPGTDASTSSAPRGASDMQPAPDGYMGENNVRGQ
jgi:hypothetical protein